MITIADYARGEYVIAVTETTSGAELTADLSYIADAPEGHLVFDFTHTASNLTKAVASEHIPGHFGFHALDRLIQQLSFIGRLVEMPLWFGCSHEVSIVLPEVSTQLGLFFSELGMPDLLRQWSQIRTETKMVWEGEGFRDDDTRRVLIPLTDIELESPGLLKAEQVEAINDRISGCFFDVFDLPDASLELSDTIHEVVGGIVGFVRGGLLAALYFPMSGYVELSVKNRVEGAGGVTPEAQLDSMIAHLETMPLTLETTLNRVARHYGTIQLSSGFASVFIGPDGSFATRLEHGGFLAFGTPGPQATAVLQLPAKGAISWESFARKRVEHMWSTTLD